MIQAADLESKVKCLFDQGAQMIFFNRKKKKCFEFENNFSRETFD